jgi:hypothetical protein
MKKAITFLVLSLLLFSCTKSPQKIAQENIKMYLSNKLDDPKSYEAVHFGTLEKGKSSYKNDPKYLALIKDEIHLDSIATQSFEFAMSMTHDNTFKSATESYKKIQAILNVKMEEVKEFEKKYKPVDIFLMKHSFRTKNKMGALVLDSCTVILDKNLLVQNIK